MSMIPAPGTLITDTTPGRVVIDGVLFGEDARVAGEIQRVLGLGLLAGPFVALGLIDPTRPVRDGDDIPLIGGCYFQHHDRARGDVDVTVAMSAPLASQPPAWLRRALQVLLNYPFGQLGCKRVTAFIDRDNRVSLEQAQRIGFRIEGEKAGTGVLVLGLVPEHVPEWLRGEIA